MLAWLRDAFYERRVSVRTAVAKWQGPLVPSFERVEPARIVQDIPPLNLWPVRPRALYAGVIRQNVLSADFSAIEARIAAWAKENNMVEVAQIDDELVYEPIAEERDADRLITG